MTDTIKIGIGGPVGSGKTLLQRIAEQMADEVSMAVVTNDIYTKEDERYLKSTGVLPDDRIIGIETGGCPHTAIREDISMNAAAIDDYKEKFPDLQLVFVESGGDNLAATFSPELVDLSIYIIDVAQGEKIPRKGGQGMIKSDFFIINKTDLAPYVGANLDVMLSDTKKFRGSVKPTAFTNLKTGEGLDVVLDWIKKAAFLEV
ncbi:urease accessory protein UreG [Secundilactobacillus collinoides]|uniref:Urease accessory protein UreG n=2 Tax=Secundilactobacillus collinoides TaxID=33960 RepID=A0A0R2BCE7_SECCO|nr:urease accessory protein UreG [Secundilactobacillus collinoides]KRM76682.1 urease accessory protein UreG [Secundilactobacillus collinoides DSM 20515 = JCM 1123]KZL35578.1 urease accessory protein UreG [Secundilactobacillus collinoides]